MKRFGQVIKVKPEKYEEYKKYHADVWEGVLDQIKKSNIKNYTIFHRDSYLFAYFEYVGNDFETDMKSMADDPLTQKWWALNKPLQEQMEGCDENEWWANMEEIFHMK